MKTLAPALLLLLAAAPAVDFPARVVGVSDGDTLTVLRPDRTQVKVRLYGVDAPETGQDFGQRAKQAASALTFGKTVTVRPVATDRYGRTVAKVILPGGRSLNHELVRSGSAWWYRSYAPKDATLAGLESEAKAARRGLWSQPAPVPPWDWRRGDAASPVQAAGVVTNSKSGVYHRPGCPSVARMRGDHRVVFGTAAAAEGAGYREAGDCRR
jgi:micrococcal nuclease